MPFLMEPDSEDWPHVGMIKCNFGPGMHFIELKSQGIPYMAGAEYDSEYQNDSEYQTMLCAENSKATKRNGFEGCKKCGDGGYYLCKYSREGYCSDCELKTFPERFYPCPYCRNPMPMQMKCLDCDIFDVIGCDDDKIRNENFKLYCAVREWEKEICKSTLAGQFIQKDNVKNSFYFGDNVWKKLNYIPILTTNAIAIEEPDPRFVELSHIF